MTAPDTRGRALALFLVLGAAAVYGPASMDANLPALPAVARDFGASTSATQLTLTAFLFGVAAGHVVIGALSDVHGRRRPLIVGLIASLATALLCALAPSLPLLLFFRVLQGMTCATGFVVTRAIVRDLYTGPRAAAYLSRLILLIGLAPLVAPILGAQVLRYTSWRGIFVALAVLIVIVLLATVWLVPETLPPDRRRPARLGSMVAGFAALLRLRDFNGYTLTMGLSSATIFTYVAGATFVLQDRFGLTPTQFSVVLASTAVAMVACSQLNAFLVHRVRIAAIFVFGLSVNLFAALALLLVTLAAPSLELTLACLFLLFGSWGLIPANTTALGLAAHPDKAATASSMLGLAQFGFGGLVAPLSGLSGGSTAAPMAAAIACCSLGALAALGFLAAPWREGEEMSTVARVTA